MRPIFERDWVSANEAAELVRCCAKTIRAACDEKTLRCFRPPGSRHRRILLTSLLAFAVTNGLPSDRVKAAIHSPAGQAG